MQLFAAHFAILPDPRAENARHIFAEMMFIAIAATLCGAKTCVEIAEFGQAKEALLRTILTLPHGVPSHDTFSTLFRKLNPQAFAEVFARFAAAWAKAMAKAMGGPEIVAIDGKAIKRAFDKGKRSSPRMMVSAWGAKARMTLAARTAKGGNEAKAAIELLGLIDIKGTIVTADALHCNRKMARAIIERGADYVLPVKGNQDSLLSDARACLGKAEDAISVTTKEKAHGRIETRSAIVVEAPGLAEHHEFAGLKAFGRIESTREIDGRRETEVRIFALSRVLPTEEFVGIARGHWGIENRLHWMLDVHLDEDMSRTRRDHGAENLGLLRRLVLNLARGDKSKGSLAGKLRRAAWNEGYMFKLLAQMR